MVFTSINYLLFFSITCLIYFLINKKFKTYWLLACSYYFYMCWNPKYALLMLLSTVVTYLSGLLINQSNNNKLKKACVAFSIIINIGILFVFKYYTFIISSINPILGKLFSLKIPTSLNVLLPVGISFYTFQALSYTIDAYRKDVKIEKNLFKYALFVSFFPQLVAGPIEKSKDLLSQFSEDHKFNWDNLHQGLLLIMIGFFYKLVIADRAAIIVNQVYNNVNLYTDGGGMYFLIATFLFAIQIYFDFNAYSTIAKGSAKVMGYNLTTNFNKPYFASSIKDFWKRWHISLSSWFKEYLYFPLGGNRKGFIRTQVNIMIVFLVSGLWHGASWTFVIWGALHGLYQVIENIISKIIPKKENNNSIKKLFKILITFTLVNFAWIFFRANTLNDAFIIIKNLFDFKIVRDVSLLGTSLLEILLLLGFIIVILIIDIISTRINLKLFFYNSNIVLRWLFYYLLIFIIIIFGIYGPGFSAQEFIYFQF